MSAKYNEDFKKEVVDAYIKSAKILCRDCRRV